MVEFPVECRPSVHQYEAGQPTVGVNGEWNPVRFSPITVKPIVDEAAIGADLTIGRSDRGKFREVILIKLYEICNDCTLAHGNLCQSHVIDHGKLHRAD